MFYCLTYFCWQEFCFLTTILSFSKRRRRRRRGRRVAAAGGGRVVEHVVRKRLHQLLWAATVRHERDADARGGPFVVEEGVCTQCGIGAVQSIGVPRPSLPAAATGRGQPVSQNRQVSEAHVAHEAHEAHEAHVGTTRGGGGSTIKTARISFVV